MADGDATKRRLAALVGVVGIAAALVVALLFASGDGERSLAPKDEVAASRASGGEPAGAPLHDADDLDASDARDAPISASDSSPTRSLDLPDFLESVGPSIAVVARETGRALPDAGVWWIARDEVDDARWRELQRGEPATLEALERDGHAVKLDALGGAELPWHRGLARLWIRDGDRAALRTLALDEARRHKIELARRETLTIRTADRDGRPVSDVPVMVAACAVADGQLAPAREEPLHLAAAPTDRDGELRCERGSRWLDEHLDGDGLATRDTLVAALAFPCRDRRTTAIDPRDGCERPVELRPPLMAELRLRAALENDAPCLVPVAVRVTCSDAKRDALPTFTAEGVIATGDGWLLPVEAMAPFQIKAGSTDGALVADPIVAGSGAVATTTELLLRLRSVEPPPMATIVVLAPSGQPLASSNVGWQPAQAIHFPLRGRMTFATTDERGRLPVPIARLPSSPPGMSAALHLYSGLLDGGDGGARLRGRLALTKPDWKDGDVLGEVTLEELPTIVAGRVVSSRGAGLPGATLHVVDRERAWMDSGQIGKVELKLGERVHWMTRSGDGGRFEIRSRLTCDDVVIRATLDGWSQKTTIHDGPLPPHDEMGVGAASVTIVMVRNGRARGTLLAEPGTSFRRLLLRAAPGTNALVRSEIGDDGRFEIEGIPGPLALQVVSRTDAAVIGINWDPSDTVLLAEIDGLDLIEDQVLSDPRLDPIDLRGQLVTTTITARTRSGAPIAGARLFLVDSGDYVVELEPPADPFGRAVISVPRPAPRLTVGLAGLLAQSSRFDRSDVTLVLPPAPRLRLQLAGADHPLRDVPARIQLASGASARSTATIAAAIGPTECGDGGSDGDGNLYREAALPFTGRWLVSFKRDPAAWRGLWTQTIEVTADEALRLMSVDLTAAQRSEIERQR